MQLLQRLGIGSINDFQKHLILVLCNDVDLTCLKIGGGVTIFWAANDVLYRHVIKTKAIGDIKISTLEDVVIMIKKTKIS